MKKIAIFTLILFSFLIIQAQVIKSINGKLYEIKDIIPEDNAIIVNILNPDSTIAVQNSFLRLDKFKDHLTEQDVYDVFEDTLKINAVLKELGF